LWPLSHRTGGLCSVFVSLFFYRPRSVRQHRLPWSALKSESLHLTGGAFPCLFFFLLQIMLIASLGGLCPCVPCQSDDNPCGLCGAWPDFFVRQRRGSLSRSGRVWPQSTPARPRPASACLPPRLPTRIGSGERPAFYFQPACMHMNRTPDLTSDESHVAAPNSAADCGFNSSTNNLIVQRKTVIP
jgi:hypothetical protein